jgi:quercetin 2,3-dioxygenase
VTTVTRRDALKLMMVAGAGAAATTGGCSTASPPTVNGKENKGAVPAPDPVLAVTPLGLQWPTRDPFLFCVHHDDRYPRGNEHMGPAASLEGRNIGQDFEGKDGYRMYHGSVVPGFPRHPHRGFETVTVVRRGLLDHSDSLGAGARYGGGDVQWLTAGNGIQHAEMFPLLRRDRENPVELFQIWLNLPSRSKRVEPYFSMFWKESIPVRRTRDPAGRSTQVTIVAGAYQSVAAPAPPPNSWAAAADSDVAIWTIKMEANARWSLPAARSGSNRSLYFFGGTALSVAGRNISPRHQVELQPDVDVILEAGSTETELLLLQGRPIGERIARHGPFVMNTETEIRQAYSDYRRTQFGGWPWQSSDPVHGREEGRFARHADGRIDRPA